jgi:hypothetical protein
MKTQRLKVITSLTLLLLFVNYLKAQTEFYPDFAYGVTNVKANGSFDGFGLSPITGTKSGAYYHAGILAKINIPKTNLFLTTGFVAHFYYATYFFIRQPFGNATSSREGNVYKGFPLTINYTINPTKKQSVILSGGIKYSVTNPQNVISLRNEISANAGFGYKFNRFHASLFYQTSLNDVSKNQNIKKIRFNSIALSLNFTMYAGRVK